MPHVDLPERLNIDERFLGRWVAGGEGGREALRLDGGSLMYEEVDDLARHRPTIPVHVPSAINQMLGHPGAEEADLSGLRFAISAGEALPESLYHSWRRRFGVEILDGLGTAEVWHIFVTNLPGDVRPGTLGRALPGFDVRVRDEEGRDLPHGEVGHLWVRGDSRGLGYRQDLDATAQAFRGEWVVSGDLVSRDVDGYFTHGGRADDTVKVKGKWFRPQELEGCLLEHPSVKEVAAVPIEGEAGLLQPVAFVVTGDAVTEAELQEWAMARLEAYKRPRRVVFVGAMPQTHLGKIDRGELRRML